STDSRADGEQVPRDRLEFRPIEVLLKELHCRRVALVFVIGQSVLQTLPAGEPLVDCGGKQLSVSKGVTNTEPQVRIFVMSRIAHKRPPGAVWLPEEGG